MSEKSEVKCLWAGLFSILYTRHGHGHCLATPFKLIPTRRHGKSSTKPDAFDQVCRKIQKSVRNLILDDMDMDSDKVDTAKTDPRKEEKIHWTNQSFSPSEVDEKIVQQARTSLETFIDQMFVDGKLVRNEVLNSNEKHKLSGNATSISPSRKLPQRRSKAGEDCKFCTLEMPSFESDIPTETVRKKIDFSSSRFMKKQDFVRLKNLNAMKKTSVKSQKVSSDINRTDMVLLHGEDDTKMNCTSENETITSTEEDVPSTPTRILRLNISGSIRSYEEHDSPVSVLDYAEGADNSSSIVMIQTDRKRLQPTRLYFEDCSIESSPQDYISQYVRLLLQAASLQPQKLLRPSLFEEVEFSMPCDYCYFDPKLLFDHVNEVLVRIQTSVSKPKNSSVPLEEVVLAEIRAEEFYLHPAKEERTLEQLAIDDVLGSGSRSWIDSQTEAERIMIQISDDILQESVVEVLLGFCR